MDVDEARELVREQHRAVLGTPRGDGTPLMTPVLAAVDAEGRVVISTRSTSGKVRNLRRDPRAWLCVLPDAFFGRWFQIDAEVEIVELPDALPLLEEYYRAISGEHEDWESYREAMRAESRVLLRLTPTSAIG
ncbi:PPOX class F420-dependent oxidoreductase [Saccharopolyspora mangrovi]|uniref:PPOX class F420-dependent oxidoreductase n=1 Tax=Saccharopolyspora mangrovi TaxID=3082379 RepID=A0ABU6AKW7_9PSEU|nr:PPOX class F420-dependent oxidoreductase [Saccharopolyspora sp. S2-29]MEB3372029.1 PPOX class F420-dependent oxidoreductase [Saccharopolyspora sp. S2-29]